LFKVAQLIAHIFYTNVNPHSAVGSTWVQPIKHTKHPIELSKYSHTAQALAKLHKC